MVTVRKLHIGEGIPKICVPITGRSKQEILKEANDILALPADLVEWRSDDFEDFSSITAVKEILDSLRKTLGDLPILFTCRSRREGGKADLDFPAYQELLIQVADMALTDLIDVEAFSEDEELVKALTQEIQSRQTLVVGSYHDFNATPPRQEMKDRLCQIQDRGADLLKLAVMPQNLKDVENLQEVTREVSKKAHQPLITMSMGEIGRQSRINGEIFGSSVTFGSAGEPSAPGQIPAEELAELLQIQHKEMSENS